MYALTDNESILMDKTNPRASAVAAGLFLLFYNDSF